MNFLLSFLTSFLILSAQLMAQSGLTLSREELMPMVGSWEGALSYLDYTTNKPFSMPANLDVQVHYNQDLFYMGHSFPHEKQVFWTDTVVLSGGGEQFDKAPVIAKRSLENGFFEFVTLVQGIDGNERQKANIKHTYTIGNDFFSIKKEVQFVRDTQWMVRHTYQYDKRSRMLSPAQMKADLALVKSAWENLHPGLYRYNTPAQIKGYFKDLDAATNSPLEQRRFFILLSQLNIKLHCGHTYVNFYNNKAILKANLYSRVFFPLTFKIIDQRFYVTSNLSTDQGAVQLGDEILSINGISSAQILDSLLTVSRADGLHAKERQIKNIELRPGQLFTDEYTLFDIFFPLFFKNNLNEPNFTIVLKSPEGKVQELVCAGLSKLKRFQRYEERYNTLLQNEQSWEAFDVAQETFLLSIGSFATFNWDFDYKKFLDSTFVMVNTLGYKNLIVDIQDNEGGSDEARDVLLSYLTSRPLGCAHVPRRLYRYTTIPDSLLPYLYSWDPRFKEDKINYRQTPEGYYEQTETDDFCAEIKPNPNHFKGKIYLITNATNSSTTHTMADIFKTHRLGTLVGQTTGGTQQGLNGGELFFFYLPNSGIEMDIPLVFQAPKTQRPDAGISPDIFVRYNVQDVVKREHMEISAIFKDIFRK